MGKPGSGWKNWGDHPVIVTVTLIAALIGIILAVTGSPNIPSLLSGDTPAHPSGSLTSETVTSKSIPGTLQPAKVLGEFSQLLALKLIYGDDATVHSSSDGMQAYAVWTANKAEAGSELLFAEETANVYSKVLFALPFRQDNIDKYIMLTATVLSSDYQCHACSPVIGGAIFSWADDAWQLETRQKFITHLGSWGTAPRGELAKIGPDKHGVLFRDGYMAQGYITEQTVVIADVGGALKVILSMQTYASNEGACGPTLEECWAYSSNTEFVSGKNPDYYDLLVKTSGTKLIDNEVTFFREEQIFTFSDSEYVLIE